MGLCSTASRRRTGPTGRNRRPRRSSRGRRTRHGRRGRRSRRTGRWPARGGSCNGAPGVRRSSQPPTQRQRERERLGLLTVHPVQLETGTGDAPVDLRAGVAQIVAVAPRDRHEPREPDLRVAGGELGRVLLGPAARERLRRGFALGRRRPRRVGRFGERVACPARVLRERLERLGHAAASRSRTIRSASARRSFNGCPSGRFGERSG